MDLVAAVVGGMGVGLVAGGAFISEGVAAEFMSSGPVWMTPV